MRNLEISSRNIKTFRYFTHEFFFEIIGLSQNFF